MSIYFYRQTVILLEAKSHSDGSGSMTKCILAYTRVQITIKKKRLYLKKTKNINNNLL